MSFSKIGIAFSSATKGGGEPELYGLYLTFQGIKSLYYIVINFGTGVKF